MPFEQILRDHLLDDAEVVPLPERGDPARAIARARTRRRHRLTAAAVATVAVVAAAGVAAAPALTDGGGDDTVITPATNGLDATGPLDLQWSAADGGLSGLQSQFQQADGTVYALSTGPGARYGDPTPLPQAIYRLDENGVWQPLELDGDHRMQDVAGVGDALYGVSTAPATQGNGTVMHLSRSGDGGRTWTDQDIPPAEPPSTSHAWAQSVMMRVESNGPTTLAVVTTQFLPNTDALFPEAESDPVSYMVQPREEGLALVRFTSDPAGGGDAVTPAAPTTATVPAEPADSEVAVWTGERGGVVQEDVRIIPWTELGVSSQAEAYTTSNQVFRLSGDTWELVANDLGDNAVWQLGVAGDLFTAQTYHFELDDGAQAGKEALFVSADGATWTQVEAPRDGQVVGAGPALVNAPYGTGTSIDVSTDGGASWSQVDLGAFGMAPNCGFHSAAGGPLGVALVIVGPEGRPEALATSADLVTWTITPLADIAGTSDIGMVTPFVGRDRIVVSVNGRSPDYREPGPSRTVVGIPRRS